MNDGGSRPQGGNQGSGGGNGGNGGGGNGGNRGGSRLRGTGREPGRISRVSAGGGPGGQNRRQGPPRQGPPRQGSQRPDTQRPDTPRPDSQRPDTQRPDALRPAPSSAATGPAPYGASSPATGAPARPFGPTAPEPMPSEPVVTPEAQALALTAWDLARTRGDREDTPRGQIMTLRTHQKLIAAFEAGRRIPEEDRTFLRVRENARASFLLIHGMSTGPADLRGLARHLGDNDCNVWVLRLPELGAVPGAVSHASWESSLLQATQRCRMLSRGGGELNVVGLGYGAALALHLASRSDAISRLVLLAPALMPRVSAFQRQIVRFRLHRLAPFRRLLGLNVDLMEGMDAARGRVGRVRVPIYAAQCEDDDRASPASLRFLQKKVDNRTSRFQVFPTGGHAILAAHGERLLYGEILKFCEIK